MSSSTKIFPIFALLILLTSCKSIKNFDSPFTKSFKENKSRSRIKSKETMEIRISCGKGDLKEFLNEGWKIANEYSEEKICSWKSVPANKKCNMETDKGCKITKPDEIGKETYYLLEK
tara:strand:+ start:150 stop:503 length:354 start_codon:yes stop_codon:yes gene_type:complete